LLLENSLYSEDHMEDSSIPLNLTLA
jgi:hypothetical protein